jgi:hypothetical protein
MRVTGPHGAILDVDFAINWRADPPLQMGVGPVLSERDAVAGKLSAVYSRGEVRAVHSLHLIVIMLAYLHVVETVMGLKYQREFLKAGGAAALGERERAVVQDLAANALR